MQNAVTVCHTAIAMGIRSNEPTIQEEMPSPPLDKMQERSGFKFEGKHAKICVEQQPYESLGNR